MLVIVVGCVGVELGPPLIAITVASTDVGAAIKAQAPTAVLVQVDAFESAWPALVDAVPRGTPIIAMVERAAQAVALPERVDDFLVSPLEPAAATARIEHAIRRAHHASAELQTRLRATETMSAMGAIVGGVAHDARNRLFGISATVDAFHAFIGPDPGLAPFFDVLQAEIERLRRLLADLLEYGRASLVDVAPGRIEQAVVDAVSLSRQAAVSANVQIRLAIPPQLPELQIDHQRFVQVFHNILINAIQFAAGGHVEVVVEQDRDALCCRVRDTGPGFATADVRRVFDPFYTRRTEGVGLGLSIVRRIVEAHDGWVEAANPEGGGAEITIRVPITRTVRPAST